MKKTAVALGTFDGVHLGHQRIIKDTASYAKRHGLRSIAITFDPHPQQFIVPERGLKLLTTIAERKELLKQFGISEVKVLKFTSALQKLSREGFIEKYLAAKLKADTVFVGFDFAFGHERSGDVKQLKKLGKKYGIKVVVVRPVKTKHYAIKSSLIRNLISHGDFNHAISLLKHPYQLTGKVVHGAGRGKSLGFPTANISIDKHKLIPQSGVYIAKAGKKKCVVNIGSRPTFGASDYAIEAHIPGIKNNLYGKILKVSLYKKIRDEIQFADVCDLAKQIRKDIAISQNTVL